MENFSLEGRFSLNQKGSNYSGRLSWQHAGANDALVLSSPFGQGMAEITTDSSGARLVTSDGKTYTAPDTTTLTEQVLGYALPLVQLIDWILARGSVVERDPYERPRRIRHESWQINYEYEGQGALELPNRVFAEHADGLNFRLRIDEWTTPPESAQ